MLHGRSICAAALLAAVCMPSFAAAETKPAVVWIPTAPVDVVPSGAFETQCSNTGMGGSAVAAGCIPSIDEPMTLTPHPSAQAIADGVAAAFGAYDLRVVTEPPPDYLPTFAVFTSGDAAPEGSSYTCSRASANCSARDRDRASFTNTSTMSCTDPDLVTTAVFVVGRMSGLEGTVGAPENWMNYPPDFAATQTQFVDACTEIANQLGGRDGMTPLPLECTTLDHVGCEPGMQNSHADLLETLGPAAGDDEPPVIEVITPEDGAVIEPGGSIDVAYTLQEASNFAGTRLTISSPALLQLPGLEVDRFTFCTSDLCDVNWLDNQPFRTADSEWTSGELPGLPEGEYLVEIEASDYYGNEAEMVVLSITIGEGEPDPTGGTSGTGGDGGTSGGGHTSTGAGTASEDGGAPPNTTAASTNGDPDPSGGESSGEGSSASGGADGLADRGCGCTSTPGEGDPFALMLGLLAAGLRRRR
ncbi:MAG: MYXO-CTERM sorting domain-containing protein [Nannocystaceae bacterium]|nr:MYXO-CTERM sorting domain-containing protein [bacterium]